MIRSQSMLELLREGVSQSPEGNYLDLTNINHTPLPPPHPTVTELKCKIKHQFVICSVCLPARWSDESVFYFLRH